MRRAAARLAAILVMPFTALAADPPVTGITLSNAGLIQVDRAGMLGANEAISFAVPVEAVDDVLKSLLLRDPGGRPGAVRLPAQDLEAEAFRGLPVRLDDFETRASLFRALRGQSVDVGGVSGRLAGADEAEGGLRLSAAHPDRAAGAGARGGDRGAAAGRGAGRPPGSRGGGAGSQPKRRYPPAGDHPGRRDRRARRLG
ncbi:hypothetical protein [Dankookia sp. P2]|uniref:hypothetical protein n=1 Tax=Dankookia sp. P2 TaxID=3423955 RepID=UPI003D675390